MKCYICLILLLLLSLFTKAQAIINGKVITLHTIVGNLITLDEKNKFSLFPEYNDTVYQAAMLVLHPDSTYGFIIPPHPAKASHLKGQPIKWK